MPIWLELLVLLLVAYAGGLAIGWAVWNRHDPGEAGTDQPDTGKPDTGELHG